ncbi:hypothetical protein YC2023_116104 [Brassica napus]
MSAKQILKSGNQVKAKIKMYKGWIELEQEHASFILQDYCLRICTHALQNIVFLLEKHHSSLIRKNKEECGLSSAKLRVGFVFHGPSSRETCNKEQSPSLSPKP